MKTEKIKINFDRKVDAKDLDEVKALMNDYVQYLNEDESVELLSEVDLPNEMSITVAITAENSAEIDVILSDMFDGKDLITEIL